MGKGLSFATRFESTRKEDMQMLTSRWCCWVFDPTPAPFFCCDEA